MNGRVAKSIALMGAMAAVAACTPSRSEEPAAPTPAATPTTAAAQQEQPMNPQQQAALEAWRKGASSA